MSWTSSLLPALVLAVSGSQGPQYLPSIQERWDASDLVCIGEADLPRRTGVRQFIDGADRDQLSSMVELERCFKGENPGSSGIRVLGNYVAATKEGDDGVIGFAYSGPPVGFVHKGRNLLFLRKGSVPGEFVVTVPVYQTSIPLADAQPDYAGPTSPAFAKTIMTRELESAMLTTDDSGRGTDLQGLGDPLLSDIQYINYLLDYLGRPAGIAELSRFSDTAPRSIQQDIAVTLLDNNEAGYESSVISLLVDKSAPCWKRGNAALALGRNGTRAALYPLRQIALEPAATEEEKALRSYAESSLKSLELRMKSLDK